MGGSNQSEKKKRKKKEGKAEIYYIWETKTEFCVRMEIG